jgi:hypothetical protein
MLEAASLQSPASSLSAFVGLLIAFALYFVPLVIALMRKVPHLGSVIVINVFLGWTIIGWVVALAMACRSKPHYVVPPGWGPLPQQQPPSDGPWSG